MLVVRGLQEDERAVEARVVRAGQGEELEGQAREFGERAQVAELLGVDGRAAERQVQRGFPDHEAQRRRGGAVQDLLALDAGGGAGLDLGLVVGGDAVA